MSTETHRIDIASTLEYEVAAPSSFVFNVAAATTPHQRIDDERLVVTPHIPFEWCKLNDQGCRGIRLFAQPGTFTVEYSARATLTPEVDPAPALEEVHHADLPTEVLTYLNPSRYCESDRLVKFAADTFGQGPDGFHRVDGICDWINANVLYQAGTTDASSGACDVLIQRTGVCRDFAHVAITLCRALGIPARYVSGYAAELQPPDFHGFFEAYLGNNWYLFDATRMAPVSGLVRIGVGRDAADASFATIVGAATLQRIQVSAVFSDNASHVPGEDAVSTA